MGIDGGRYKGIYWWDLWVSMWEDPGEILVRSSKIPLFWTSITHFFHFIPLSSTILEKSYL